MKEKDAFLLPRTKAIGHKDLNKFLRDPLIWEKAVCRCFCAQCQSLKEIDWTYTSGLLKTMNIMTNLPNIPLEEKEDFKNYYFEIGYCEICKSGELSVKIKEIGA